MRIQTSGDYEWHTDLYDRTADRLGEGTRSGRSDGACEFTRQMLDNLEEALWVRVARYPLSCPLAPGFHLTIRTDS